MKPLKISSLVLILILLISCGGDPGYKLSKQEKEDYLRKGQNITARSFEILSGELKAAIQREGFEGAIPYCHLKAVLIIDSVADPYQVEVNRVSIRNRNPENAASKKEKAILENWEMLLAKGEVIKPEVKAFSEKEVYYYSPIFMKPLCLTCHGTPGKELTDSTFTIISRFYPEDLATGYKENDLRGMWAVRFR